MTFHVTEKGIEIKLALINRQWKGKEAKDRLSPLTCSRKQIMHDHPAYGELPGWENSTHTRNESD